MSIERMPAPGGGEPAPPVTQQTASREGTTPALQLQVLATEHWGLLATRALAWNESFARAGMLLSALSGAIVALALAAQATGFGVGFVLFAVVILPVVLFLGVATFLRMGSANYYDALCVVGMNRIRNAYVELVPEVERYLVMSPHDDERGLNLTMGVVPRQSWPVQLAISTPFVVAGINAVIGGVLAVIVLAQVAVPTAVATIAGITVAALVLGTQLAYAARGIAAAVTDYRPMFPSPDPPRAARMASSSDGSSSADTSPGS
jgi:hypothetical protein